MSKLLLMQTLFAIFIALFASTASFHRYRNRTKGETQGIEHQKYTLFSNNSLPNERKAKDSSGAITKTNNSNPRKLLSNNTRNHENRDNSTDDISNRGCNGDKSSAICHTYIHNMYKFYSTVNQSLISLLSSLVELFECHCQMISPQHLFYVLQGSQIIPVFYKTKSELRLSEAETSSQLLRVGILT